MNSKVVLLCLLLLIVSFVFAGRIVQVVLPLPEPQQADIIEQPIQSDNSVSYWLKTLNMIILSAKPTKPCPSGMTAAGNACHAPVDTAEGGDGKMPFIVNPDLSNLPVRSFIISGISDKLIIKKFDLDSVSGHSLSLEPLFGRNWAYDAVAINLYFDGKKADCKNDNDLGCQNADGSSFTGICFKKPASIISKAGEWLSGIFTNNKKEHVCAETVLSATKTSILLKSFEKDESSFSILIKSPFVPENKDGATYNLESHTWSLPKKS